MRHLVAWAVGLCAGVAAGAVIYALARRKGFAAVEKAGEGGFVWVMIALAALLAGGVAFSATRKYLDRRARARADAERLPAARVTSTSGRDP